MKKKNLMFGATLMMGMFAASCSSTLEYQGLSDAEKVQNAEQRLGIAIDPAQDWNSFQNVNASVSVVGDWGASYTVKIYENNPFINNEGVLLAQGTVTSGKTCNLTFETGIGTSIVYAAIVDAKGYTYVKPAAVVDGKLTTNFGGEANKARTRTASNDAADVMTIPVIATIPSSTYAASFLEGASEANATNASEEGNRGASYDYYSCSYQEAQYYTVNYKITQDFTGVISPMGNAGHVWTGEWENGSPKYNIVPRTVYVGDGATWTIPSGSEQRVGQQGTALTGDNVDGIVVVDKGGKIVVNGEMNFVNCARLVVMPGGEISGTGSITVTNGTVEGQEGYNGGTIKVASFNENFGTFFNYGLLEVGTMAGGSGGSTFVNHGKVKVTSATAGSATANMEIKNNCWFECAGELACKIIEQGTGAYIKAASLTMSDGNGGDGKGSHIYAKANSLIDVAGNVSLNGVDIVGPYTGDYAFLQFGKMTYVNYSGEWGGTVGTGAVRNNIYVSVDTPEISESNSYYSVTHYERFVGLLNGNFNSEWMGDKQMSKDLTWTTVGNGNATLVQKGQYTAATVEESECSPGIKTVDPTPIVETFGPIYSYAFEDTEEGDYDLNDAVIQIREVLTGTNAGKLQLKLVAAGATLDNYIYFNGSAVEFEGGSEIHDALGVDRGTMVNTGRGTVTKSPVVAYVTKPTNADMKALPIELHPVGQPVVTIATTGQDPHGVVIPGDWKWPLEREIITSAYPGFADFASDVEHASDAAKTWYSSYTTGKVYGE